MKKMKKVKKKFYAIKEGKGVKNIIVNTWSECSRLVLGYNSVYKSFLTRKDAEHYLSTVNVAKVKAQTKKGMEYRKTRKTTTKVLNIGIPNEIYNTFKKKCKQMDLTPDQCIVNMIKEWII